ncbi:unnamed protein product [Rhodiola kirilowii]
MDKRTMTMTMNWEGLGEIDDDDHFFESRDRISCAVPVDLASSGSDEEEFDDSRISFASAISSASINEFRNYNPNLKVQPSFARTVSNAFVPSDDYNVWMAEPGSIRERRQRLLQGMGLSGEKELLKLTSIDLKRGVSTKVGNSVVVTAGCNPPAAPDAAPLLDERQNGTTVSPSPLSSVVHVRSRSDGDMETSSVDIKKRKEQMFGSESKQQLTRTYSELCKASGGSLCGVDANLVRIIPKDANGDGTELKKKRGLSTALSSSTFGAFFLIKNLDTGKEFIVNEFDNEGMWNRLSDLQTGKQLTREEFEKCVGHSPVVKELMRRENVSRLANGDIGGSERKVNVNSYLTRSFRYSKRRGVSILKNIKGVANSMSGLLTDKENSSSLGDQQRTSKNATNSEWVKVRAQGKSHKELTALRLCQEIHAHEGSIWTIKFSPDACYLASAGEDRVIHVWEVQECEVMPSKSPEHGIISPFQSGGASPETDFLGGESPSMTPPREKEKKKKGKKKGNSIPDYVYVPETVFSLSEKPFCSFTGHQDDILDLSWSKSQLLLSSSMDKTVRLWDLETKSCLKLFAHNDYVTCIQFNPVDDRYFISGSLDAKVRIWNIPSRKVVDWTDLHEMVTAACYTPDGQGALIGSHKGSCRMYSLNDCKLNQIGQIDINTKKSQAKKITGFQFAPGNPSDVLITSADSRIRIYDGTEIVHKFRGFRNTNSQISASYGQEGKYIVSASEDSQVYVWKCDDHRNSGKKGLVTTRSHEHFHCKDVSVAVPWPGVIKGDPPAVPLNSKRHSKRSTPTPSNNGSPTREEANVTNKRNLPPLPKRKDMTEKVATSLEEDPAQVSRTDSELGDSFSSSSASIRYGESPSISSGSQSWSSSWSLFDGGSHGAQTIQPTTWGLVIVTAGLGGEIRAYQNFGLPIRIGRQTNLF